MGRIGVSLSGIERALLNRLADANAAVTKSTYRMATGNKINSAGDDPSAFVALSGLQTRLGTVTKTAANVSAAGSVITQTQTALGQIGVQLNNIRTELLADEDGSLTQSQRDEAQANIDAAILAINDIANSEIGGKKTLSGSANFNISGVNPSEVADVRVYAKGVDTLTISGEVTAMATQASLSYTGDTNDEVTDTAVFSLSGNAGTYEVSVTAGDKLNDLADEINANSHKTGITAVHDDPSDTLTFTSVNHGSNAEVDVDVTFGTFDVTSSGTANGTDATATIDSVEYTGNGNRFTVVNGNTHYEIEFDEDYAGGNFNTITASGDALTFSLFTDVSQSSTLSIPSLNAARLGGLSGSLNDLYSGGSLSGLDGNTSQAIRVVDEALGDLVKIEGAVDGFYNASISTASTLMADLEDDLEDAISDINDVDNVEETQLAAMNMDLASNAIAGLAILDQQRSSIVNMIQAIAGL